MRAYYPHAMDQLGTLNKTLKMPSAVYIVSGVAVLFLLSYSLTIIPLYFRRRQVQIDNGCKAVRRFKNRDPIFGLDWIFVNIRAARNKSFLETISRRFDEIGTTFGVRVFNQRAIFTTEPENIKAVLSLRFKDFSLGNRPGIMGKLLGKGIFTTDGKDWAHSRAMLRPNFVKDQVATSTPSRVIYRNCLNSFPAMDLRLICSHCFFALL